MWLGKMQSLKALVGLRQRLRFVSHHQTQRPFSAQPNYAYNDDLQLQDQVTLSFSISLQKSLLFFLKWNPISGFCSIDLKVSEFQVLVQGRAKSRAALLNRPSALNALSTSMVFFFLHFPSLSLYSCLFILVHAPIW